MNQSGKIMTSFLLSQNVLDYVVRISHGAKVSQSEMMEKIITEWSQMAVTGVVEEVTQKDVFDDINRELKGIHERLKSIDEWQEHIYDEVTS